VLFTIFITPSNIRPKLIISLTVALNAVISLLSIEKIKEFSSFFKDIVDRFDF
jgi:hypothetical protein